MNEIPLVYVAALTYRRPDMLSSLLAKWLTLERPQGWTVRFLVVDNDAGGGARSVVESFVPRFGGGELLYVVEPEPGIPFGRGRALREATARGARLLAFIDDDEYPNPVWLRELVAHQQRTGAVLIGGPVRLLGPNFSIGPWQRFLVRSLVARSAYLEAYYARKAREGRLIKVGTGNWLGDLAWLNANGVSFDPAFRDGGGEDARFLAAVQSLGGRAEWCERAIAYEYLQPDRLSVRYQFRRGLGYGITKARLGRGSSFGQLMRVLVGGGLICFPLLGWASPMLGVQLLGTGVGWFAGLRGARTYRYAHDTAVTPSDGA